jgi:hypothetical protein
MIECASQQADEGRVAMLAAEKDLAAGAPEARDALRKARDAFDVFQRAHASWASDVHRGGTLSNVDYASSLGELVTARADLLRSPPRSAAPLDPPVAARVAKLASAEDAEGRKLLRGAEARHRAYRRLEVEALVLALGGSVDRVALGSAIDARWVIELERRTR